MADRDEPGVEVQLSRIARRIVIFDVWIAIPSIHLGDQRLCQLLNRRSSEVYRRTQ